MSFFKHFILTSFFFTKKEKSEKISEQKNKTDHKQKKTVKKPVFYNERWDVGQLNESEVLELKQTVYGDLQREIKQIREDLANLKTITDDLRPDKDSLIHISRSLELINLYNHFIEIKNKFNENPKDSISKSTSNLITSISDFFDKKENGDFVRANKNYKKLFKYMLFELGYIALIDGQLMHKAKICLKTYYTVFSHKEKGDNYDNNPNTYYNKFRSLHALFLVLNQRGKEGLDIWNTITEINSPIYHSIKAKILDIVVPVK